MYAPTIICLAAALINATPRQRRQANFGGGSRQPNFSNNQGGGSRQPNFSDNQGGGSRQPNFSNNQGGGSRQPNFSNNQASNGGISGTNSNAETDNKIFFGNPAIDNGLLGAGLGIGGILLAQNIANSNNQCNCRGRRKRQTQSNDPNQKFFGLFGGGNSNNGNCNCQAQCNCGGRRKRQTQSNDPNQKFFGLFGGGNSNSNNCNCAASAEFGVDCKGRPQGDRFHGCGCDGNSNGGLFSFGRKKRQINQPGEDVNEKFLNFRCLQATLTGRQTNNPSQTGRNTNNPSQFSVTRLSQG